MGVFFSGTDTQELHDNAPNHNFYLSLIVNNRNEMEAQVAMCVKELSSTTTLREYKDLEGNVKNEQVELTNTKNILKIFKCDISKPKLEIDEVTRSRFRSIAEATKAANAQKIKEQPPIRFESLNTEIGEDAFVDGWRNFSKQGAAWKGYQGQADQKELEFGGKTLSERVGNSFKKFVKSANTGSQVDGAIREFLIDLLGREVQNQTLKQIMGNINRRRKEGHIDLDKFLNKVFQRTIVSYNKFFTEDPELKKFHDNMAIAQKHINDNYHNQYQTLAHAIVIRLSAVKKAYGN